MSIRLVNPSGYLSHEPLAVVLQGSYRMDSPASVLATMPQVSVYADASALALYHANQAGRGAGR
jgi:hypothetical protein